MRARARSDSAGAASGLIFSPLPKADVPEAAATASWEDGSGAVPLDGGVPGEDICLMV